MHFEQLILFGSGMSNRRALYTSAGSLMDDERKRSTLRTLIEIAESSSPADCWDDGRAVNLLRSRSTPEELRELGASEALIRHIFGESDDR